MVETGQRFDVHVDSLIAVFVSSSSEEIECVLRVKVILSIEVASNKVVDLDLGLLM